MRITIANLDYFKDIENQSNSTKLNGGIAISLARVSGFARGSSYTNVIARIEMIAISSSDFKFSSSSSSVSSVAK